MVTILQMHRFSWETNVASVTVHSASQQEARAYCISQGMLHTWYNLQDHSRPSASSSHQQKVSQVFSQDPCTVRPAGELAGC